MKPILILLTAAVVLASCDDNSGINSRGWHFLTRYQETPDYKALAITPSGRREAFSMGIGHDSDSVQVAIDEAMQRCEKGRERVMASLKCRLQMVGDVDVSAMDDAAVTAVIAKYEKRTIDDHDEAVRLDSGNAIAYYNRADAQGNKGEYDRAIEDYSKAIGLNPTYTRAYLGRGYAYQRTGQNDRAIEDYSKVIELSPGHAHAYNNRCWSYGLSRRPEEALRDCNESLQLRPDDPAALDSRALAYWLLGEQDKAKKDLERARAKKPDLPTWQDRFREFEELF